MRLRPVTPERRTALLASEESRMKNARVHFADRLAFLRELKEAGSFIPSPGPKRDEDTKQAREERDQKLALLATAKGLVLEELLHHAREYVDATRKYVEILKETDQETGT